MTLNEADICENVHLMKVNMNNGTNNVVNIKIPLKKINMYKCLNHVYIKYINVSIKIYFEKYNVIFAIFKFNVKRKYGGKSLIIGSNVTNLIFVSDNFLKNYQICASLVVHQYL